MRIAGLQKTSLIDYPGKIVSTLFTQGCNLRCPYCHNRELIPLEDKRGFFPVDELLDFLTRRQDLLDGVCITGGEPTIQPGLKTFVRELKVLGFVVKLDTNGTNPEMISELLAAGLLDYLAMDVKAPPGKYEQAAGRKVSRERIIRSISLIKESGVAYEFRTTIVPGLHRLEDITALGFLLEGAELYYLQNFRPVNTLDPGYAEISPFPPTKLTEFKKAVSPYVKRVGLRE